MPTADNTHEVAQHVVPESRVVYVDNDPIVLSHARALLTGDPKGRCTYIDADDPYGLIRRYLDAVPSGSYLAISHASSDLKTDTVTAGQRYNLHSATAITFRSRQEVARLLAGLARKP